MCNFHSQQRVMDKTATRIENSHIRTMFNVATYSAVCVCLCVCMFVCVYVCVCASVCEGEGVWV